MAVAALRSPVVLVHGLFGFDRIGVGAASLHYFPRVAAELGREFHDPGFTARLTPILAVLAEEIRPSLLLLLGVIQPLNVRGALFKGLALIILAAFGAFFTVSAAIDAYAGEQFISALARHRCGRCGRPMSEPRRKRSARSREMTPF